MGSTTPSIRLIDSICNEPLDLTPISSPLLPATPSHLHDYHESVVNIRGYNPSFDPYCAYLEDELTKSCGVPSLIMLLIFLWPLTLFAPSFLVFSYSHHLEMQPSHMASS